jgi:two-component system LytT family sensor kinase
MISLEEELKIADDYLQMEQLRFGFAYQIETDQSLSQSNIDIPAMLLQPFIENAVKHGIAILKKEGHIRIGIAAGGHNLLLSVEDNGKGFDIQETPYMRLIIFLG